MLNIKTFIFLVFSFITFTSAKAQMPLTWDDFCEEYFSADDETSSSAEEQMEILEGYLTNPIDLNQATRADLLSLPFLNEAQADSILSFRENKKGFISLGDLMFIRNISFSDRRYMKLFVVVGDMPKEEVTLRQRLFGGRHEVETRLDIPLYTRAGQKDYPADELQQYPNRKYLGNGLANIVRYRYDWHRHVRYGITLEKDTGEPFGNRRNYPYDYVSAFFLYESPSQKTRILAGDYKLISGQGLLLGSNFLNSSNLLLDAPIKSTKFFRPHTGSDENNFFRGAASSIFLKNISISFFASYNKIDARIKDGIVTSLPDDGYHRTINEINGKNAVGNFSAGARIEYGRSNWEVGLTGLYTLYDKTICPDEHPYNKYYLRGKSAGGLAADWYLNLRHWTISGEAAADNKMNLAMSQTVIFQPEDELSFTLQHRHFSKAFISQFGETAQQGSRVANEHGIMLGGKYTGFKNLELRAYADAFLFPSATFQASRSSKGLELMAEGKYHVSAPLSLLFRYKMKTRQQDVSGYSDILEYRQTHRLHCALAWQQETYQLRAALDATIATRQTTATQWGWAASLRAAYRLNKKLSAAASAVLFFTDDYSSAVYIYEPRLRHTFTNTALYYHGFRIAALASWRVCKWLDLSAKYSCLHYFNKKEISSGPQLISSPTKQDISLQLRLLF